MNKAIFALVLIILLYIPLTIRGCVAVNQLGEKIQSRYDCIEKFNE